MKTTIHFHLNNYNMYDLSESISDDPKSFKINPDFFSESSRFLYIEYFEYYLTKPTTYITNLTILSFYGKNHRWSDFFSRKLQTQPFLPEVSFDIGIGFCDPKLVSHQIKAFRATVNRWVFLPFWQKSWSCLVKAPWFTIF